MRASHAKRIQRAATRYGLSAREIDVLLAVADGCTNGEVAEQLGLSPRTVQRHLERIFDKVGVRTRAGAVAVLLRGQDD